MYDFILFLWFFSARSYNIFFQEFLSQILVHLEKKNQEKLCEILNTILENPPSLNLNYKLREKGYFQGWSIIETNLNLLQNSFLEGIQNIPEITNSLKAGAQLLSTRVFWKHELKRKNTTILRKKTWGTLGKC